MPISPVTELSPVRFTVQSLLNPETSSTTLTWALLLLALHPDVQSKCREEIDRVLGSMPPKKEDAAKMPYVSATLGGDSIALFLA